MAGTAFNAIAAAVVAQLQQGTPVADVIDRARPASRPINTEAGSAVVVRLREADATDQGITGAPRTWETFLEVECYARSSGAAGGSGEELVDPLVYAVAQRLDDDPTLGGLSAFVDLQNIRWGSAAEADRSGDALLTYRIVHQTSNNLLA